MQENLLQLFVTSCSVRVFKQPTDYISLAGTRCSRGTQISGSMSPLRLNVSGGTQYLWAICMELVSCYPSVASKCLGCYQIFLKICARLCRVYTFLHLLCDRRCFCTSHTTKGLATKEFLPNIKDRLKTKINLTPNFTAMTTAHGKTSSYPHRFKIIESPKNPCANGNQTVNHLL